jgi:hypothetical protein
VSKRVVPQRDGAALQVTSRSGMRAKSPLNVPMTVLFSAPAPGARQFSGGRLAESITQ